MKYDSVIKILERTKVHVTDDSDACWTRYKNGQEFREDIDNWIERLKSEDETVLKEINIAFAPTSSFQDHACSNGWGEEYLDLATQMDQFIGSCLQDDNKKIPDTKKKSLQIISILKIIYIRVVQGIHVISIVFSLLGSIPMSLIFGFLIVHSFLGYAEPSNFPEWLPVFHPFLMLPVALFVYCFGKWLGAFVKNDQLQRIAEVNRIIFETCFIIAIMIIIIFVAYHGEGFSK